MKSEEVIESLIAKTKLINIQVENIKRCDLETLNWRENQNSWSILECIEHLNRYGDYYIPEIEKTLEKSNFKNEEDFNSGLLGNYFAKSMLPKENRNKIKTFKDKNPIHSKLDETVFYTFLKQQNILLDLLNRSKIVSLNKTKIKISISKFIKLKLGDTFQFYINHIIRHFDQIEKIKKLKNINF
ncbi:DinB family protein [Flavobacterium sp. GP15]|uniref:DinB family protein n=1 Tax=Flavobacterium sp. GP15 TaxID=2758567 RepID=UPI00165DD91F|nr:DinB family protein [Flavobacterium sp. GP15]